MPDRTQSDIQGLLQSGSRLIRIKAQNEQHQPVFGKFLSQDPDSQIYNV